MPQNAFNEDLLNQLGEEFAQQVRSGQNPSIDDFAQRHPEHQEEVRDFLESIEMLEDMKKQMADPTSESPPKHFGRYTIERTLGEGGMGAVYLAHDSQLDRKVAIKVPKFKENSDPTLMERFYREARSAATLQHPNICPVYDVGEMDGIHYISMAFIEGRPLSDYIKSSKAPPINSILRIIRKVALALQEAHDHGVIHRDLKPANIMISRRNEPIVMDFGLARQFDDVDDTTGNAVELDPEQTVEARLTQHGTLLGSPGYMAPEQLQGQSSGPVSDIYALGVVMYELLTQQLPFPGNGTLVSVVSSVLADPPPDASRIRSEVDPAIVEIVRKAMAKKVRDRFESMQALAMALTRVLKSSSSSSAAQDSDLTAKEESGESPELVRTREQFELATSLYQEEQFAAAVSILEKMSNDSGENRYTEWAREQLPKARAKAEKASDVAVAEEYSEDDEDGDYWTQDFDATATLAESPSLRQDRVRDRRRKRQRVQKIKTGMAMAVGAAIVLLAAAVAKEVFFSGGDADGPAQNDNQSQAGRPGGNGGQITDAGTGGQGDTRPRQQISLEQRNGTAQGTQPGQSGDGPGFRNNGQQPPWRRPYQVLISLDTNGDRKLTMAELQAASLNDPIITRAIREFAKFDKLKDNALDSTELEFLVRPPHQQGPGGRGPGGRGRPGQGGGPGGPGAGQTGQPGTNNQGGFAPGGNGLGGIGRGGRPRQGGAPGQAGDSQ